MYFGVLSVSRHAARSAPTCTPPTARLKTRWKGCPAKGASPGRIAPPVPRVYLRREGWHCAAVIERHAQADRSGSTASPRTPSGNRGCQLGTGAWHGTARRTALGCRGGSLRGRALTSPGACPRRSAQRSRWSPWRCRRRASMSCCRPGSIPAQRYATRRQTTSAGVAWVAGAGRGWVPRSQGQAARNGLRNAARRGHCSCPAPPCPARQRLLTPLGLFTLLSTCTSVGNWPP